MEWAIIFVWLPLGCAIIYYELRLLILRRKSQALKDQYSHLYYRIRDLDNQVQALKKRRDMN